MTGAEHYLAGERLLEQAADTMAEGANYLLKCAQTHFMAAQVAAVIATSNRSLPQDWAEAIGRVEENVGR